MSETKLTEKEYKALLDQKVELVNTLDDLNALIKEIVEYNHDYGTIVYGMVGAMKAAFRVVDKSPSGGITGFQAGFLGWALFREYSSVGDGPLKIVKYENMLFPQYEKSFTDRVIDKSTFEWLQNRAKENMSKYPDAHELVKAHQTNIINGIVPFGFKLVEDDE